MRMKLPFFVAAIVLAATGNAVAGQGKDLFPSVTNPTSSKGIITFTKYSRDEIAFQPTVDLHITSSNPDSKDQTFNDLSHAQNNNFFGGGPSRDFAGVSGGHALDDFSDTFVKGIENSGDIFNRAGDSTRYFSCSIVAVPEPDEWLLALFGLGLVGSIVALRKQEASV